MICSMTAFGRTQREESGFSVTVEIRALNSRGLDTVIRLPKTHLEYEEPIRKQITQAVRRGRIEVFIQIETTRATFKAPRINVSLARMYWEQLQSLHRQLPGSDPPRLEHLLGLPSLFETTEEPQDHDVLGGVLARAMEASLEQIQRMKCEEGQALLQDCLNRLAQLREDLAFVHSRRDFALAEYQNRLRDRIQELLGDTPVDENRLLQEVACAADRWDINEETVRLQSHLDQMEELLKGPQPAEGRRLDFFTQELHREANTIGCKTTDLETVQAVVRMKTEIGKLKEQVQNIE